jgi:hypothetical protein
VTFISSFLKWNRGAPIFEKPILKGTSFPNYFYTPGTADSRLEDVHAIGKPLDSL